MTRETGRGLRYLSLFSGMEAATIAWGSLGWCCVGVAEVEPAACALLAHRFPDVPNLGDVTAVSDERIAALGPIDVVIGGSPCQDLSVAGKRAGLAGERSGLFHEQLRIFDAARTLCGARWLVWENVPGAFSSHAGRDFAVVVGAMAGCELAVPAEGWGSEGVTLGDRGLVEWGVLDAQWFGVPQRRRRVFAVLDTGDWAGRPPVLLEPESMRGDPPARREAGQGAAAGTIRSTDGGSDVDHARAGHLIPETAHTLRADGFDASEDGTGRGTPLIPDVVGALTARGGRNGGQANDDVDGHRLIPEIAPAVTSKWAKGSGGPAGDECQNLVAVAFSNQAGGTQTTLGYDPESRTAPCLSVGQVSAIAFTCKDHGADAGDIAPTLRAMGHAGSHANAGGQVAVALHENQRAEVSLSETSGALKCGGDKPGQGYPAALVGLQVRRLTPRECERLQGAPDDWTLVPNAQGKPMADGPRYKMIGNSFARPVVEWIGRRIDAAHRWVAA